MLYHLPTLLFVICLPNCDNLEILISDLYYTIKTKRALKSSRFVNELVIQSNAQIVGLDGPDAVPDGPSGGLA